MWRFLTVVLVLLAPVLGKAQTDIDALMMDKKQFCVGPMYSYGSWKNYWEGTLKRENLNLGTVSTQSYSIMGNYGISTKLNVMFSLPYIKTNASAGQLKGLKGLQDLSFYIKYLPVETDLGPGTFSLYTIGGFSIPVTNYVADYLPLSIGLHSKTAMLRLMADYQVGNIFVTTSGTYVVRDNITIDRTGYYTTSGHLSNEVAIPNVISFNARAGYRSEKLIAEAVFNNWVTQGGFDITRNNMPFPSNQMNASTLGVNFKYVVFPKLDFSIVGGANTTIGGRNIGASTTFNAGIFYVLNFRGKEKATTPSTTTTTTP